MEAGTDAARGAAMVKQHGAALLRVARRHSLCEDDAPDAFQRGREISTCGAWTASMPRPRSPG